MTDERSALKFSAAMMVFGLGDTILPHFPPPIMAISSTDGDSPRRFPMDKAMGATVITATSIKTPTVHSSTVLRERDADLHVVLVAHKLKIRHGNTVRQIEVVLFKDI